MAIAEVTPLRALQQRNTLTTWSEGEGKGEGPRPGSLRELLPAGLRRGSTVTVTGSTSLALAVAVTATRDGSWCAAVNSPDLGVIAAAEAGIDLEKLALIPRPGDRWPVVTATLIDAFDVVLLWLQRASAADARRLSARARERDTILVPVIDDPRVWPQADLRLHCDAITWHGLGSGHGHLASPQMQVSVSGRGAASQVRRGQIAMAAS